MAINNNFILVYENETTKIYYDKFKKNFKNYYKDEKNRKFDESENSMINIESLLKTISLNSYREILPNNKVFFYEEKNNVILADLNNNNKILDLTKLDIQFNSRLCSFQIVNAEYKNEYKYVRYHLEEVTEGYYEPVLEVIDRNIKEKTSYSFLFNEVSDKSKININSDNLSLEFESNNDNESCSCVIKYNENHYFLELGLNNQKLVLSLESDNIQNKVICSTDLCNACNMYICNCGINDMIEAIYKEIGITESSRVMKNHIYNALSQYISQIYKQNNKNNSFIKKRSIY